MNPLRFVLVSFMCSLLFAQTNANKASIAGVVSSTGGLPIPAAKVSVVNEQTGLNRETETNSSGRYHFEALDPGTYEIQVDSAGATASVKKISLSVGGTMVVNIGLAVQTVAERVDLTSSALSLTESNPTDVVTDEAISGLPIDGRRFQDFATLLPGIQALPETRGQLSFLGQRGIYSNVMLDGTDYNEPFLGGIRSGNRSTYSFTVPQSAIQEFQAIRSSPPVEYGRTVGGTLNAGTRSGVNSTHGEAFYQIRDQSLGLADPLGQQSLERQQQFGGGAGGAITRDKLFYFAAVERQAAAFPRNVNFATLDSLAGQVTPDIAPAYNYFRSLQRSFDQTNDATAVFGRLDYQFSSGNRFTVHYNDSQNQALNAVSLGASIQRQINQAYSSNGAERDRTETAGGQWINIVSSSTINDLRVQYTRENASSDPNEMNPSVVAGSIGTFGTAPALPVNLTDYRFQIVDGVSVVKGQHSVSFGADYDYIGFSQLGSSDQFGTFTIASSDVRRTLQILSGANGTNRFDDPSVVYSRQVGSSRSSGNVHQGALYAMDNWRLTPSFTLTYGVRWETQINPQPVADNSFLVSNVRDFAYPRGRLDPTTIRNQFDQWGPRIGFAWGLPGNSKTVIRSKAGIFYAQTPLAWLAGAVTDVSTAPSDLSLQIGPAGGSTVYQQFLAGGFDLNKSTLGSLPVFSVSDVWANVAGKPNMYAGANVVTTAGNNFRNPRSTQLGFSVEREIASGLVVAYELNHVNSVHLERNVSWNIPAPFVRPGDLSLQPFFGLRSSVARPNPNLGWIMVRDSSAHSNYLGHSFRIQSRLKRLQLGAHYTLSYNKSDDDNEGDLASVTSPDPFNFTRDYNWSSIDSRHQADGFALWQAAHGIEIAGLFHFRSGLPIDATTAGDTAELLSGNIASRPLSQPGVYLLRNAFRNRSFKTVDLRISKTFPIKEKVRLQFYSDLFNAFNFDNVAFLSASVYPGNPAFIYGPGILPDGRVAPIDPRFLRLRGSDGKYDAATTGQQGTPFQVQLGMKVVF